MKTLNDNDKDNKNDKLSANNLEKYNLDYCEIDIFRNYQMLFEKQRDRKSKLTRRQFGIFRTEAQVANEHWRSSVLHSCVTS